MKTTSLIAATVLLAALWSCKGGRQGGSGNEKAGLTAEKLIGRWVTEQFEVTIESKHGSGRDSTFTMRPAEMGQGQTVTTISGDGKYTESRRSSGDSLLGTKDGYWHLFNDTIFFRQVEDGGTEMKFGAKLNGKRLQLGLKVDWDGDGRKDDRMEFILKKL